MNKRLIFSTNSFVVVCLLASLLQPSGVVFAQNGDPCANHPLGQKICQRALQQQNQDHDRLDLNPNSIQQAQSISQLGGNMNAAAGLTQTISNVGITDVMGDNPILGMLLGSLSMFLGGNVSNIAQMFTSMNAGGISAAMNNPQDRYPQCNPYNSDYRDCIAPYLAPTAYNQSIPGMNNFGNMGNVGNIAGQMFGNYNVGAGNTGAGIAGLLGMNGGAGSGIFGMFGGSNNSNGNWLGTILTTLGALTGNSNLIMAGQVVNTLSAMNQQNQAMQPGQPGTGTTGLGTGTTGTTGLGTGGINTDYSQYTGGDGSMPVSSSGNVSKDDLFAYMNEQVKNSDLNGYVPADGAKYGIDGSSESWARYFTELAGKESSYNIGDVGDVGKFGTGSRGLFQLSTADATNYGLQSDAFTHDQLANPYTNANAALSITSNLVKQDGVISGTNSNGDPLGASRYWGPLQRGWTPGS